MKTTEYTVPESLKAVWEWKDAVSSEIEHKSTQEKLAYFREGLDVAAKLIGARLVKNADGTYCIK